MLSQRVSCVLSIGLSFVVVAIAGVSAQSQTRPFNVVLDGFAAPEFVGPCTIENTERGTGHATHMGTITWLSEETVDICAYPDVAVVEGRFVLTSARGDQVTGSYRTVARLDFAANEVSAAGLYTITGGTGRFTGATGRGVVSVEGSLLPPFALGGQLTGTILF
jgi:hypothetical protein